VASRELETFSHPDFKINKLTMIKTRPNNSIIFHWVLVIVLIVILIIKIRINVFGFLVMIGLLLLTLIINRTTYLYLEKDKLKIVKKNFLFIPTFSRTIDLDLIETIEIEEYINESFYPSLFFEWALFISFIGGLLFYLPRFKLSITSNQEIEEIEINTRRKEFISIESKLIKDLKDKIVRKKNNWPQQQI